MTQTPNITIGMPVYNGEPWLPESLASLLQQTWCDFVLVISDNASTDATAQICREAASRDSRVRYLRNDHNIGAFRNYNRVFQEARTPFFKWAAANDLCAPTFLERCLAGFDTCPDAVLVAPRTVIFADDPAHGERFRGDPDVQDASPVRRFKRVLAEVGLANIFNGVIRSDALRTTGLNGTYLRSDKVLLAELALRGKLVCLPDYLFFRRMTSEASTSRKTETGLRDFFSMEDHDVLAAPDWDFCRHCLGAVLRAPITVTERLRCAAYVGRMLWWLRSAIWRELQRHNVPAGPGRAE
jgi:glycosyltransferase involved in cell wall biosynthesis